VRAVAGTYGSQPLGWNVTLLDSRERIASDMDPEERGGGNWTLLTGHGHVLAEIARNARARIRDIAAAAGIAERAHREYDGA
jgi:hypothetical protein